MEMFVRGSELWVSHGDDKLYCGDFRQASDALFEEINAYWASLSGVEAERLYTIYQEISECSLNNVTVPSEYFVQLLDVIHPDELMVGYIDNIAYPKNATEEFIAHKHYTKEETYTRGDYRDLAVLAIRLRSLIPVLSMDGLFTHQRANQGAGIMFKSLDVVGKIGECEIFNCDAFERLKVYIEATSSKILENNRSNIIGSILDGIGSSDLPEYLLGVGIILGVIPTSITKPSTNLAKAVNNKINDELTKKIVRRFNITDDRPGEKLAAGEDSKMGYFETYQSRQQVPDMVPMINGVWGMDYRKARHALGITSKPALIKIAIDSAELNPYSHFTSVHQFIVRAALRRNVMHQTIQDISFSLAVNLIGLTQTLLIENKLMGLARILSSNARSLQSGGGTIEYNRLSLKPMSSDYVELLDRYYKNKIPSPTGRGWVKPYQTSIDHQCSQLEEFFWEQKASKEMCELLGTKNGDFQPTEYIRDELAQLLALTATAR